MDAHHRSGPPPAEFGEPLEDEPEREEQLQRKKRALVDRREREQEALNLVRKKLRAHGSFDARYWSEDERIELMKLRILEIDRKIALLEHKGPKSEWPKTARGQEISENICAQQIAVKWCQRRGKEPSGEQAKRREQIMRSIFIKLFTTSKMGVGITRTGAGPRNKKLQKKFRADIITAYGSKHETDDLCWCPILHSWEEPIDVVAAHLFTYRHGQDTMDAIFGYRQPSELFSPENGLLISKYIERFLDSGKLIIVPHLPKRPIAAKLLAWIRDEKREYKVKILDQSWELLHKPIAQRVFTTWKELDNRPLSFRTDFRPAARYLYFHYCMQVLRRAWQANRWGEANEILIDEIEKPFWGISGRYLPENMLLALVDELGHDHSVLLDGASCSKGEPRSLVQAGARLVRYRPSSLRDDEDFEDDEGGRKWRQKTAKSIRRARDRVRLHGRLNGEKTGLIQWEVAGLSLKLAV